MPSGQTQRIRHRGLLGTSAIDQEHPLDEVALLHPADLDGLALLYYHRHGPVAIGELEHPLVGLAVLFYVVLYEVHPTPLQILVGDSTLRTACRGIGSTGLAMPSPKHLACCFGVLLK